MKKLTTSINKLIIISLISTFPMFLFAQPTFSGNYTIGATGANYPSITAAVNAIKAGVVVGPVTFKINPGKYNERITIPFLNGATSTNTVTFTSANNNPNEVVVQNKPSGSTNVSIFKFDNASFINIKNISIINNGKVATGVHITNVSAFNTIENCIIRMDSIQGFNIQNAGIYGRISSGGSNDRVNAQSNTVKNCKIFGGNYGVYFEGCCVTFSDVDNKIIGNEINYATAWPIHARYNHNLIIDGNKINTLPNSVSSYGISVLNGSVRSISGNHTARTEQYGFFCQSMSGEGDGLIKNNMIGNGAFIQKTSSQGFPFGGMFMKACNNINIIHNSVNYDADDENGRAFHIDNTFGTPATSIGVHILNNSFSNMGTGFTYRVESPDLVVRSDFNNLYGKGEFLAFWGTNTYKDLQALKAGSGKDASSISTDPLFFTGVNLHTSNPALNGKASYQINVSDDYDLQTRNTSTPDIGADEFDSHNYNIACIDAGPDILIEGEVSIQASFRNEGTSSLIDSAVSLSYSINGGSNWSDPETFIIKSLGNYRDVEKFTFQKKANISTSGTIKLCVRLNSPGLKSDPDKLNDQYCKDVCVGLSGTYTIGGVSPDYSSIGEAANDLNSCGIGGDVTFNIRPGTYNEQVQIGRVSGASEVQQIIFQSESGNASDVLITSDGSLNPNFQHTLQFNNASHIQLNNLSIENTQELEASTINFTNKSFDIKVNNCKIFADSNSLGAAVNVDNKETFSNFLDENMGSVRIENNEIEGGYLGIRIIGDISAEAIGGVIKNNSFKNIEKAGIQIVSHTILEVSGNTIQMKEYRSESFGIDLFDVRSDYLIKGNYIYGSGKGAIILNRANGKNEGALIVNNMLSWGLNNFADSSAGIIISESEYLKVHFNSILFSGTGFIGSAIRIDQAANINLKNNILFNNGGGFAYHIKEIGYINESNHNCLFTTGAKLAFFNNGDRNNFIDLKTSSGQEQNSISIDPNYKSTIDLHTNNDSLDAKGTPVSGVVDDFDGQVRSVINPDIGADEFSNGIDGSVSNIINPNDGSKIEKNNTVKIKVKINNQGTVSISNFPIICKINGVEFANEIFTNSIDPGNNSEYEFTKSWSATDTGKFTFCVRTNINSDIDIGNDESCANIEVGIGVGISKILDKPFKISAYPNPFSSAITINYILEKPMNLKLEILNSMGQTINSRDLQENKSGNYFTTINENLKNGLYIIRIKNENYVEHIKIIKVD